MESIVTTKIDTKYKGVRKQRKSGRIYFRAEVCVKGDRVTIGIYHDPKVAAKAYDLYILKNNLNRKTNFLKKKENGV